MAKPFDATLKQLLDDFAVDWAGWLAPRLGLAADVTVEPLDVDLSTVQVEADKVFRLRPPAEGLLHIEPQASWDGTLAERLHLYHALLHDRYGGPVYSVALLLRREANSPALTGTLTRIYPDGREYLRFGYDVIRVWELPAEPLLTGGWGATPLALLTDEARGRLGEFVDRIDERLRSENAPDATRRLLLTSGYILLGLRYDDTEIDAAFERANAMQESTTYQAILRRGRQEGIQEGRQEGRQEGLQLGLIAARHEDLLAVLSERFGTVPADVEARVRECHDPARLQVAIRRAVKLPTIEDLQL